MKFNNSGPMFFLLLLPPIFLISACGEPLKEAAPGNGSQDEPSSYGINWGHEVNLDEMITMAREDRIKEIQWHILPNILRAETADGKICHLKNENKGVDLRNTLINSGVRIGDGGIQFRHFF